MAVADNLEESRAGVIMIHGMPFNAEAPPAALEGDITPTEFHYIRSNFAVPSHDGALEIGGAVAKPTTLTLDDLRAMPSVERAVTLECAGNGRLATRPAADRRAVGRLRGVDRRRGPACRCGTCSSRCSPTPPQSKFSPAAPITARTTSARSSPTPISRI